MRFEAIPLIRSGSLAACLLIACTAQTAMATTLVRCKIDRKIVYSDTDCPADARARKASGRSTASKPIRIKSSSKKASGVIVDAKKPAR